MKLTPSAGCGVSFKHSAKKAYTGIFLISGLNMSTYVVGDIQGCFEPFQHLLAQVRFNPDKDCLWSTGDLVNRGPQNLETLRWFYTRRDNVNIVLGNHDLHLMAVSAGVRKPALKTIFMTFLRRLIANSLLSGFTISRLCITNKTSP